MHLVPIEMVHYDASEELPVGNGGDTSDRCQGSHHPGICIPFPVLHLWTCMCSRARRANWFLCFAVCCLTLPSLYWLPQQGMVRIFREGILKPSVATILHPTMVDVIQRHTVDGVLLFTVYQVKHWMWPANWAASIAASFPSNFSSKRLIVGVDDDTCSELLLHDIKGCTVDNYTESWFSGVSLDRSRFNSRSVRLKFAWTAAALLLGVRAIYNDCDVAYSGELDPLELLVPRQFQEAMWPDLLFISDHISRCTAAQQKLIPQLVGSSSAAHSWMGLDLAGWGTSETLALPCPMYNGSTPCVSTGFWVATPNDRVTCLFMGMLGLLNIHDTWEQELFQYALGAVMDPNGYRYASNAAAPIVEGLTGCYTSVSAVALDPRVLGNAIADRGCRKQAGSSTVQRIGLHMGWTRKNQKITEANAAGLWRLPMPT
jgi:hypothetical protein